MSDSSPSPEEIQALQEYRQAAVQLLAAWATGNETAFKLMLGDDPDWETVSGATLSVLRLVTQKEAERLNLDYGTYLTKLYTDVLDV